jgi:hypothetical protein
VAAATGRVSGILAPKAGAYTLRGASGEREIFSNLLNSGETGLKSVASMRFGEDMQVAAAATPAKADRPLWKLLASAGFALLLVEWWYFHRRPVGA